MKRVIRRALETILGFGVMAIGLGALAAAIAIISKIIDFIAYIIDSISPISNGYVVMAIILMAFVLIGASGDAREIGSSIIDDINNWRERRRKKGSDK